MMENTLWTLGQDETCSVLEIKRGCAMARRLTELGFIPGERVTKLLHNRGMAAFSLQGTLIALRKTDAACVSVREVSHAGK